MDLDIVPTLAALGVAWDALRRFADAYHNRARLTTIEDLAHETKTEIEALAKRMDLQSTALAKQGETLIKHGDKLSTMSIAKVR